MPNSSLGYHGHILHIDLNLRTYRVETPQESFYRIYAGGALLGVYYMLKETEPGIDALGPENRLVFANSIVAGHPGAGLVRYVVSAKSPLTNGIGETRTEGRWAVSLKKSGFDALIISGAAERPTGLLIDDGSVSFFDAEEEWGMTVGNATDTLETRFGDDIDVAAIGPAGENLVRFASIVSSRTHQAQRMGMGAVMGSKRLKSIVLKGGQLPPISDQDAFERINETFARDMETNILSRWQKDLPGFAVWVHDHGLDAALDVENFRTSSFEETDAYAKPNWLPFHTGVATCPGCPNDCMKMYDPGDDDDLDARAGAMHQEVTGAMGPNIGTGNIQDLMRYNNELNQLGMDPVSLGFTLSFAMEALDEGILTEKQTDGLDLRFGNATSTLEMIRKIAYREGFGNVLAEGCKRAADELGEGSERLALHVKGLEMVPFEPRSQTNLATGYAVASVGPRYDICEHDWDFDTEVGWEHTLEYSRTLGILERLPMEHLGEDKVRNFKALHTIWSGADALGMCTFAVAPTRALSMPLMADMLSAVTGWETSSYEIMRWGERRLHLMRVYNNREGMTRDDDWLPDRFFDEPIQGGAKAGAKLDRKSFRSVLDLYYEMMGWDEQGVPRPGTLYDHHLEWTM
jgi:aldehyde:ferredoxin oxidoreductase